MDLKFSFGGASPDHSHAAGDHGGAPSGIPLPFAGAVPVSTSSELDVVVRLDSSGDSPLVVGEVITGDGVTYSRGDAPFAGSEPAALAKSIRSAVSRAVAGLEGPLAGAITSVRLQLDGSADALEALGVPLDTPAVTEALQARLGVNAGVPIEVQD